MFTRENTKFARRTLVRFLTHVSLVYKLYKGGKYITQYLNFGHEKFFGATQSRVNRSIDARRHFETRLKKGLTFEIHEDE